jgi:hypothetical protein
MTQYQTLREELKTHLVVTGLCLNAENPHDAVVVRSTKADIVIDTLLDYLIGAGYASVSKTTDHT